MMIEKLNFVKSQKKLINGKESEKGVAFGAALGTMFESIGIALGISIGIILGTTIALVFGKKIVQLFGNPSKDDTKEETD